MTVTASTRVEGALLIEPASLMDDRGAFAELYQLRDLRTHGWEGTFVRSALSFNRRAGTLRGLHYQCAPHQDAKLVTCIGGALFDVVADIRPASPTFGQWDAFELSAENRRVVFLPEGVAHGFLTRSDTTTVLYHLGAYYDRESGAGIRWDDPTLKIEWPLAPVTMSEQDQQWGFLSR